MHSEKKPGSPDTDTKVRRAAAEDCVPLSVRNAQQMHKNLWPDVWTSFAQA